MIPPNASLVKYDNPALVSRNTDKKSPRVSLIFVNFLSRSLTPLSGSGELNNNMSLMNEGIFQS